MQDESRALAGAPESLADGARFDREGGELPDQDVVIQLDEARAKLPLALVGLPEGLRDVASAVRAGESQHTLGLYSGRGEIELARLSAGRSQSPAALAGGRRIW
jgi:hypothetical protein